MPAMLSDNPTRRPSLIWLTAVLAAAVVGLDQASKWWALAALAGRDEPVPLIGHLITLHLVYNPGAALSIATGTTWVLTLIVVVVVAVILRVLRRIGSRSWTVALGLLLGGALGNLIDRLARDPGFARGHVIDFIDYFGWFVGNVADIVIVVAAGMIIVLSLFGVRLDGSRPARHRDDEP